MKKVNHMDNELEMLGAATLNSLSRTTPFLVPAGYFDMLPDHITAVIQLSEAEEPRPEWSRQLPFQAPAPDYFEHFAANIAARATMEEPEHILEELPRSLPFSAVPAGYFEQFSNNLIQTVRQETTPVPQQKPRQQRVTLFHGWQLAASVALIIFTGLGILRFNNGSNNLPATVYTTQSKSLNFSGISKDVITEYIDQNIDEFDTELIVASITETGNQVMPELNVSNAEIENYLDEDGWN